MRLLLGIVGAVLIVLGGASAAAALVGTVYDDSSYSNDINCTSNPSTGGTTCYFTNDPSDADHQFTQVLALGILGGSAMVTGGGLVAGSCALSVRDAARRDQASRDSGGYGGPPPAPYAAAAPRG